MIAQPSLPRTVQAAPSDREKRLEAALQWYADRENYATEYIPCEDSHSTAFIILDEGDRARAALADTTNNDGGES